MISKIIPLLEYLLFRLILAHNFHKELFRQNDIYFLSCHLSHFFLFMPRRQYPTNFFQIFVQRQMFEQSFRGRQSYLHNIPYYLRQKINRSVLIIQSSHNQYLQFLLIDSIKRGNLYNIKQQDMMRLFFLVIVAAVLSLHEGKLYQVLAVISPGARYHVNQLYDGKEMYKVWGEITPVGMRQMENLGRITRKEYIEKYALLSSTFQAQEFQIYSTSYNRSIISSLAHLYGAYSLGNGQKLEPALPKYHMPPFSSKKDAQQATFALPQGQLLHMVKYNKGGLIQVCLNEQTEISKNIKQQESEYNQMLLTYTPFLKKLATTFKIDPSSMTFKRMAELYDTINVDRYLARPLPQEFKDQDLKNVEHLYNWYNHFTMAFNLSRAYSSFKISNILGKFQPVVRNSSAVALKWTTLSVDLKDIVALHNDLNISSAKCIEELYRKGSTSALNCEKTVPFASNIIFQLHSDNQKDFYVKVRNNGKYMNLCEQKNISCPYESWKNRISKVPINVQSICGKVQQELLLQEVLEQ